MKKLVCMCASLMIVLGTSAQQKVMFDLFHGQFKDTFVDSTYYDYVIPGYEEIAREGGYQLVMNKSEITAQALDSVDALLILSPLSKQHRQISQIGRNEPLPIISGREVL